MATTLISVSLCLSQFILFNYFFGGVGGSLITVTTCFRGLSLKRNSISKKKGLKKPPENVIPYQMCYTIPDDIALSIVQIPVVCIDLGLIFPLSPSLSWAGRFSDVTGLHGSKGSR